MVAFTPKNGPEYFTCKIWYHSSHPTSNLLPHTFIACSQHLRAFGVAMEGKTKRRGGVVRLKVE